MKWEYFKLAFKNLKKRKLRSVLTMLGIIVSISTIFILISLSLGLESAIQEQFRLLGADKFFVMSKVMMVSGSSSNAAKLTTDDINIIKKISGIKSVTYSNIGHVEAIFNKEKRFLVVAGIEFKKESFTIFEEIESYQIDEGKKLEEGDRGLIMIGSQYKYNNLFKKEVKIGDRIEINGKEFRIKTILKSTGNPSDDKLIYMNIEDFKELFNSDKRVDQIIVQVNEGESTSAVAKKVEKKLRTFREVTEKTQDFVVLTPDELLESFRMILSIITGFLLSVAAISLIVGSIGIANTMFTSVLERTREIGVMKAIGAKNSDVMSIFLIESGILGLLGGIVGIGAGYGIGKIIEYIAVSQLETNLLKISTPFSLILGCLIFSFLIGAISGTVPAYRASKIKTVEALRYE